MQITNTEHDLREYEDLNESVSASDEGEKARSHVSSEKKSKTNESRLSKGVPTKNLFDFTTE